MAILIISNSDDVSTTLLIKWLQYYKASYYRCNSAINNNDSFSVSIDNSKTAIDYYHNTEINVVWHRRDSFEILHSYDQKGSFLTKNEHNYFFDHQSKERDVIKDFIISRWEEIKVLPENFSVNKLNLLQIAKGYGIQIPETLITNNKKELENFMFKHKNVITNSLSDNIEVKVKKNKFLQYTIKVEEDIIQNLEEFFFPSLFQKAIQKKVELRIFYLNGAFYSMAMFTQKNNRTEVDFRHYDSKNPTRNVPFKLPENIENKLDKLMRHANLNTGSIDMILTEKNEYFFLEVNPIGQYGMTSVPCNYNLNKIIANYLIKEDDKISKKTK